MQQWLIDAKGCVSSLANPDLHLTVKPRNSRRDLEQIIMLESKKEAGSKERHDQIFNFFVVTEDCEVIVLMLTLRPRLIWLLIREFCFYYPIRKRGSSHPNSNGPRCGCDKPEDEISFIK